MLAPGSIGRGLEIKCCRHKCRRMTQKRTFAVPGYQRTRWLDALNFRSGLHLVMLFNTRTVESSTQFIFGLFKTITILFRQSLARPINVEREHRHRRTIWIRLTAMTSFRGAL